VLTHTRTASVKLYLAVRSGKQGVILAAPNVITGVNLGASLANNDATCGNFLSAKNFNAKAFAFGIATVAGTTACFFVCHC
jgi:hypothetical protein